MIKISGMNKVDLPLTGGVDEISPVNKIDLKNALKMENFRISKDGKRVEKRLGLAEEATAFGMDVYGYSTYYDSTPAFCQLAILESEIHRKVGSGAWAKIHDFATNVAHPVKPLTIQGKQFIIHEGDSRMVHTDKADYQIGITAPTTLPTNATSYTTETVTLMPLNDTFAYANTTALDAVWTDLDVGNGQSTIATSGPATQGPDAHNLYLKLTFSSIAGSGTHTAERKLTTTVAIGSKYTLSMAAYFDAIGGGGKDFRLIVRNGSSRFPLTFWAGNLFIQDSKGNRLFLGAVDQDVWTTWKFDVDATNSASVIVTAYKNDVFLKTVTYTYNDTTGENTVEVYLKGEGNIGSYIPIAYVDNIKITGPSTTTTTTVGEPRRYAVTYFRGGNFGCESNPVKSVVGSSTYVGEGGHYAMTTGGTYTSNVQKTFRVAIDGAGSPNTFKWSEDDGATWSSTLNPVSTTAYLPYGITLTFGSGTSHIVGDYWSFVGKVCVAAPVNEQVTLSSIPTSSDAQVTGRYLYRTTASGSKFYWLATINDNTTTGFVDNVPDLALGYELEEDRDIAPKGKFSAWWDDRLWISGDDIVYYSDDNVPEEFDLAYRYCTVLKGDMSDEITGLTAYKDALYVFRKKSIFAIQKTSIGYGVFLVTTDVGCVAPFSVVEVNNMLMFISNRGVELFNGADVYEIEPSLPIDRTIKTIDMTKTAFICGVHYPEKREVWWSIPDRLSGTSAITIVYHYIANAWYFFSFYKTPSCLVSCYDSLKSLVVKMGTRDGCLDLCESTYRDNTTAITATYRKPWYEAGEVSDVRRVDCEYEIPSAMALTVNVYVNFDKDIQRTDTMVGETIAATDIELRRPHLDFSELGQRAKYVSVEFTNAENLGGHLKLNEVALYYRDRAVKGKIYGD